MLNHIVTMGRLVRDPELRHTQSGISVPPADFRHGFLDAALEPGISEHFLHRIAECVKRILRVHGVAVLMSIKSVALSPLASL